MDLPCVQHYDKQNTHTHKHAQVPVIVSHEAEAEAEGSGPCGYSGHSLETNSTADWVVLFINKVETNDENVIFWKNRTKSNQEIKMFIFILTNSIEMNPNETDMYIYIMYKTLLLKKNL